MKIKNTMKDEIYILQQPKHSVVSIILVNSEFPLQDQTHQALGKLGEITDLMFVFPREVHGISEEKFTSLYEGCGWIKEGKGLIETYLHVIQYCLEIFERHPGFCITRLTDLTPEICDSEKILTLTVGNIVSPVFKTRKLGSQEFYDIYRETNSGIFKTTPDNSNMYASYTSDSGIMYFKRSNLGAIIDFQGNGEKYIRSFTLRDPRYFFASVCKYLGISTIDSNLYDLDIGKL